jgi:hypothetical protein
MQGGGSSGKAAQFDHLVKHLHGSETVDLHG